MINRVFPKYQTLPLISEAQIKYLRDQNRTIALYDELVLDVSNFEHPGSKTVFDNSSTSIVPKFEAFNHSYNAKLMLCNLAIGKISKGSGKGIQLMKEINQCEKSIIHEEALNKIDFAQPLLNQLKKLTPLEQQVFTEIPKYFTNDKIRFKETQFEEIMYLDRFWVSIAIFSFVFLAMVVHLFYLSSLFDTFLRVFLFFVGMVKWTLLQYYFHRMTLHVQFKQGQILNGHYIHHSFPKFKNKLALGMTKVFSKQIVLFLVYQKVLGLGYAETMHLFLGLQFMIVMYDSLHYYFHHGPELNIPILKQLRKNHLKHHFRDQNRGFGVTTTFWDWVFGTNHLTHI